MSKINGKNKRVGLALLALLFFIFLIFLVFSNDEEEEDSKSVGSERSNEYYGSSTDYACEKDEDCMVGGCNAEVCQGAEEESVMTPCIYPDSPLPGELSYSCSCVDGKCQWSK